MEPIIKKINIDAPVSKVWKALTDPESLGQWITMPNNIIPVIGGEFMFEAESRDEWGNWDKMIKCKVTELIPEKKISYTWASELIKGETLVSFELNDIKGKTELTLTHSGWENLSEDQAKWKESHNKGWRDLLSRLEQSLSQKKPVKLICDVALLLRDKYADDNDPVLKTLLVKYTDTNKYDLQKGWFIPDDAIVNEEHPDDAAVRILKEQLGVEGFEPVLGFIESFTGGDKSWHLVFHYYILIDEHVKIANEKLKGISDHVIKMKTVILNPVADIAETKWFPVNALPERKEIAHGGWAMFTIEEILNKINS